ncbi:hypothetical protein GCM10023187_47160 [Nibrella viscosa]|uniref:Bacterial sugar transferase domain-containing protein n=1 Tax=Nibrella viscosa TaxID=1084524 RepID=A0ABP8KTC5_9BACT
MLSLPSTVRTSTYVEESDQLLLEQKSDWSKRLFDVVMASLVALFILSWLIPLIGLAIRFDSAGPILFVQLRTGRNGRIFRCFKFRTMTYDRNATFKQAVKNDSRITATGSFLRRTNLDEMPQFLNVLMGDMSIVGPRPHPIQLDAQYWDSLAGYRDRYGVKPGITGLAQVRGCRGETREWMDMAHRVRFDHFYIRRRSLLMDLKICWWTVQKMIQGDKKAF